MKLLLSTLLLSLLFVSLTASAETKYTVDPAHTSIDFTVSHMVISSVT